MRRLILLLPLLSTGCATMRNSPTQTVGIETNPPGATCKVDDFTITTPASITLRRSAPAKVSCELPGYQKAEQKFGRYFDFGNAVMNNIFCCALLPGLVVDALSGSTNVFEPAVLKIALQKPGDAPAEASAK